MPLSHPVINNFDTIDTAGTCTIIFGIFICVPIITYYLYKFHKHYANESIMKYRNKSLIYTINILSIFILTIERTYLCINCVINIPSNPIPIWTCYLGSAISFWSIFLLFLIKTYLLFYSQRYHLSMINITWKKQINENIQDWYIKQKQNGFGNFKFLLKISLIPFIFIVSIETFGEYYLTENTYFNIVHLFLITIPLILSLIIFCKTKSLNDHYRIRKEILYQIIIITFLIIFHVIFFIIFNMISLHVFGADSVDEKSSKNNDGDFNIFAITDSEVDNDSEWSNIMRLKWLIYIFVTQCLLLLIALLSTAYPISVHNRILIENQVIKSHCNARSTPLTSTPSSKMREMILTISHTKGFKLFMQHLVHEFSTENLLFIVELIQIKYSFQIRQHGLVKVPRNLPYNSDQLPPQNTLQFLLSRSFSAHHSTEFKCNTSISPIRPNSVPSRTNTPLKARRSLHLDRLQSGSPSVPSIIDRAASPSISLGAYKQAIITPKPVINTVTTPGTTETGNLHINVELHTPLEIKEDEEVSITLDANEFEMAIMNKPNEDEEEDEEEKNNNKNKKKVDDDKYMVIDINAADFNTYQSSARNTTKSLSREKSRTFSIFKNKSATPTRQMSAKSKSKSPRHGPSVSPPSPIFAGLSSKTKSTSSGWEPPLRDRDGSNPTMVKNSIHSYIFHSDGNIYIRIELPPKLPMSTILNHNENLVEQMTALYDKYVSNQGMHQLNISYESRKRLKEFFEVKLKKKKENGKDGDGEDNLESFVFNVLDEVAKEILMLMIDSFRRFQSGDVYQSFYSKYAGNKGKKISRGNSMIETDTDTTCLDLQTNDKTLPVLRNMTSYNKLMQEYGSNINE